MTIIIQVNVCDQNLRRVKENVKNYLLQLITPTAHNLTHHDVKKIKHICIKSCVDKYKYLMRI